ncbi:MAG: Spi family protease inhibitor [Cytophagaceae bacterium]|jgi:hypothetical protein|nr:Spi family protease inhibitor [Cytophagaceae bacterium]
MKRIISIFCFVTLLFSCNDDFAAKEPAVESSKNLLNSKSYVIPVENVLAELNSVFEIIDALAVNNVAHIPFKGRKIMNIKTVRNTNGSLTGYSSSAFFKSGQMADDDTLLYIINLQNSSGYAVLAADSQIPEPVLAIVENGSVNETAFVRYNSTDDYDDEYLERFLLYNAEADDYYVSEQAADNNNPALAYIYSYA